MNYDGTTPRHTTHTETKAEPKTHTLRIVCEIPATGDERARSKLLVEAESAMAELEAFAKKHNGTLTVATSKPRAPKAAA